jgi:hypothetical protein
MQARKEIDRGDIKLAIDMLVDIDDPATEHILVVLMDCGNEIAKLRVENEHLRNNNWFDAIFIQEAPYGRTAHDSCEHSDAINAAKIERGE